MASPREQAALLDRAVRQSAHVDEKGTVRVNTYQDVQGHLDYAAKCRRADAEHRGRFGRRGDLRRTMTLPFNVMLSIAQAQGIPGAKIFEREQQKKIIDIAKRDYPHLRTTIDKRI